MPRKAVDGAVRLQSLNLKTTKELRERMEDAARQTGRALTQEVETRLHRTFDLDYLLGDTATAFLIQAVGSTIRYFEKSSGSTWDEDLKTRTACYEAAVGVLRALMRPDADLLQHDPADSDYIAIHEQAITAAAGISVTSKYDSRKKLVKHFEDQSDGTSSRTPAGEKVAGESGKAPTARRRSKGDKKQQSA